MNRKASTHQWWVIAIIILALLVMVILVWNYYGNKGVFMGVKDAAETLWSYAPNVSLGLKALNSTGVTLPGKQEGEVNGLKATIQRMLGSSKDNCFDNFGGFKEDLGEGSQTTKISVHYINDGKREGTAVMVTTADDQNYESFFVDKMKPCVVAGTGGEAYNFFNHFVRGESLIEPYYRSLNSGLEISYQSKIWGYSGNILRVLDWGKEPWGEEPVNDQSNNFFMNGVLFKGKGNNICFFPVNINKDADEDGIARKYVFGESPLSFSTKLKNNDALVKLCS